MFLNFWQALVENGARSELEQYFHAWDCYKQIYATAKIFNKDRKLQEPSPEQWLEITALSKQIDIEMAKPLRQLLITAGEALLQYLSPRSISLNQPVNDKSVDGKSELGDSIADELNQNSLEAMADRQEAVGQFKDIYTWLQRQLDTLDVQKYRLNPQIDLILELRYRKGLSQSRIAEELKINQATVARNITKVHEILAKLFIEWAKDNLNASLQSTDIQSIGGAIHQWLKYHYQKENPSAQEPKI